MSCTITPVIGQDESGNPRYGSSVSDVKCFAFGSTQRIRSENGEDHVPDYHILFNPDAEIGINYKITDVKTHKDNVVFNSGRIVRVESNYHPKRELVLKQAYVRLN